MPQSTASPPARPVLKRAGMKTPQETAEALRASQHERDALAAQRDGLARQLAAVAAKIGAGVIPEPAELAVPAHIAAAAAGAQVPRSLRPCACCLARWTVLAATGAAPAAGWLFVRGTEEVLGCI